MVPQMEKHYLKLLLDEGPKSGTFPVKGVFPSINFQAVAGLLPGIENGEVSTLQSLLWR